MTQENGFVVPARGEELANCVSEIVECHPESMLAQINGELSTTCPTNPGFTFPQYGIC